MSFHTEIAKALKILKEGKTLLYPTDTVWGIGCDATNPKAVEKVFQIKKRKEHKSFVILVASLKMLCNIVPHISNPVLKKVKNTTKPTSFILQDPIGLAQNLTAKDNSIAIRIVQEAFCKELITAFGKPIVSTSANISGVATPGKFSEIQKEILQDVDYIVDLHKERENPKASQILKIDQNGKLQILRK